MGRAKQRLQDKVERVIAEVELHHHEHHRRSESARRAILNAADDLLVERGFAGVTVEGIAARAGVGKQTIYRWWTSKVEVLMETFVEDATEALKPPDSGGIDDDLRAYLRQLARFLTRSDAGAVLKALLGHAQHDATMAAVFRTRYLRGQRAAELGMLTRAVARGQLPSDLDPEDALDMLVGPLYYRALVTGEAIGATFVDGVVSRFLIAVRTAPSVPRSSSPR
jgi:AcrR family transcriptional regulator